MTEANGGERPGGAAGGKARGAVPAERASSARWAPPAEALAADLLAPERPRPEADTERIELEAAPSSEATLEELRGAVPANAGPPDFARAPLAGSELSALPALSEPPIPAPRAVSRLGPPSGSQRARNIQALPLGGHTAPAPAPAAPPRRSSSPGAPPPTLGAIPGHRAPPAPLAAPIAAPPLNLGAIPGHRAPPAPIAAPPRPASMPGAAPPRWPSAPGTPLAPPPSSALSASPRATLIVDDDLRAGARIAASLIERGHTCRAVGHAQAARALADQPFDAALVALGAGVQPEVALAAFRGWTGTVVISAAEPVDSAGLGVPVASILERPHFLEDLVAALELPPATAPPASPGATAPDRHEREAQVPLDAQVVRATVVALDGQVGRGRLRSLSPAGFLGVDVRQPLALGSEVQVEIALFEGRRDEIPGRVIRAAGSEMVVALEMEDGDEAFLRQFLRQALDITVPTLEPVRLRQAQGPEALATVDDAVLERRWQEVLGRFEDDPTHQRFIQECVRGQRLELAIAKYRALKQSRPDDQRVDRYLQQVGTILAFYAFRKEDRDEGPRVSNGVKITLALFVVGALILWVLAYLRG